MTARGNREAWVGAFGFVYVIAWIVGLVVESGGPAPDASASDIAAFYLAHQSAQLVQPYLIDGVAGVSLLLFAAALYSRLRTGAAVPTPLAVSVLACGLGAASVSLVQAGVGEVLANVHVLDSSDPAVVQTVFVLLNNADTFKLLTLAAMIAATAIKGLSDRSLPGWSAWLGAVTAVFLAVGGFAFPLDSSSLYLALYPALILLLVWVAAVSILLVRPSTTS